MWRVQLYVLGVAYVCGVSVRTGERMPASGKAILENGHEPEYVVDQIARVEPMTNGMVRLYIGAERQGAVRVEYSVVISTKALAEVGRMCLIIAADAHNCAEMWNILETAH